MSEEYSIERIVRLLQKGGGLTRARTMEHPNVNKIKQTFVLFGWVPQYIEQTFALMTDTHIESYTAEQFISEWAHYMISSMTDVNDIQKGLRQLGLRSDVVVYLMTVLTPLQNASYTNDQLLDVAIEHLLKETHPRIQPVHNGFFTATNTVNTWVPASNRAISYMNVSGPCSIQRIDEISHVISGIPTHTNSAQKLFYHTSSWHGVTNILAGLSHKVGRTCTDFGVLPGFYMSETIYDCLEWGERNINNYSGQVGVVIFALPQVLPTAFRVCELTGTEWSMVTKQSRRCKNKKLELEQLRKCHFVYGDMVANTPAVKYGRAEPFTHTPPKKQFVSKHDLSDEYLQTRIIGCLFFQDQRP